MTQAITAATDPGAGYVRPPHVRDLLRRDIWEVLAIDEQANAEPWTEGVFLSHLRDRETFGVVAENRSWIGGYMVYRLRRDRLELLRFGTYPDAFAPVVGHALIERLKGKLRHARLPRIVTVVNERNLGLQQFYRSVGFKATGVLRGEGTNGDDAYAMEYRLEQDARS